MHRHLTSSLFKEIAHVFFSFEIAHAFGSNYAFGPLTRYKVVEICKIKRSAAIEHPSIDTVFVAMRVLCIVMMSATTMSFILFVVVMMVSTMGTWSILVVMMVMAKNY